MEKVKAIFTPCFYTPEELEEMTNISQLFSPKLIFIVYKSLNIDYTLSHEEFEYIQNYPLFNVNEILEKFGVRKGLGPLRGNPNFLKDFIMREYKKMQKLIENDFKEKGFGLNTITGNNHKEKIAQRNKRQAEFLKELDGDFFVSGKFQQVEKGVGLEVTGLLELK